MTAPKTTSVAGAKVTLNAEVPTAQMAAPKLAVDVTDESGRVISLRRPGVLAQYQLVEAAGDTASNRVYMSMVMPLIFIGAIDGEPVGMPSTKFELEALIKRLGEPGVNAVLAGVTEHFEEKIDEEASKNG